MSSTLIIAIDWVVCQITADTSGGIRWGTFSTLDLNFADDLALLSHIHQHIQEKTTRLRTFANQIGLRMNTRKSEVMILNNANSVLLDGQALPQTVTFTHLHTSVVQLQ